MGYSVFHVKKTIDKLNFKRESASNKRLDIIGNIYNNKKVLSYSHKNKRQSYYKCICLKCKREYIYGYCHIINNLSSQCRACTGLSKRKGCGEITGFIWANIRYHANDRNIKFDITPEYAWELFLKQNKRCALTGIELKFGSRKRKDITASLDRIDSSKSIGYVKENIQWVHKRVNMMKQHFSEDEFVSWCKLVAKYNEENQELKLVA